MKFTISTLLLLLLFQLSIAQHTPWRPGEMEVKVTVYKPGDAEKLISLHLNGEVYSHSAILYVTPGEASLLKQEGFDYTISKPDLNAWSAGFGPAMVPPGYYTSDQIMEIADSLALHFPAICKKEIFGYTPQMKELGALKISDNADTDENEAEVMLDGGIHGDEVGGSQNVIQFARDLCLGYGTDSLITALVNNREIWLYYCVNPYGRDYMTRYNSNYVDINRDFGYMWGGTGNSPGPFSQPESRALRDCQNANQFVSYTNYHSGFEVISYPWSYRYSSAPDKNHFDALAQVYSESSGYGNLGYGQGSNIMYLIEGSTKDYTYACNGSIGWSIEISNDKQPAGNAIQYYYDLNKPAMLALIEHSGYGISGTVTDAVTHKPVAAMIFFENNYPAYSDPVAGDYHKYMKPGTYTMRVTANGYETKEAGIVTVIAMQTTVKDVDLNPLSGQYAWRTTTARIPNFEPLNPGDEVYTAACLGPPDQVNYSIGKSGYVMVDMLTPVVNGDSTDITVYEGDDSPEGYSLYAGTTIDGPWQYLGFAYGTASFDLSLAGMNEARYFQVKDDNDGQANVSNAGFDLDALASRHPALPDTVGHAEGHVFDAVTGIPLPGAIVASGDSAVTADQFGHYRLDLPGGEHLVSAASDGYRNESDTLDLPAGYIVNNDFYLYSNLWLNNRKAPAIARLKVSPNPFSDEVTVCFTLAVPSVATFRLAGMNGSLMASTAAKAFPAGENSFTWKIASSGHQYLSPGSCMLIVEIPGSRETVTLIRTF